jgi:hypothetical protein
MLLPTRIMATFMSREGHLHLMDNRQRCTKPFILNGIGRPHSLDFVKDPKR